MIWPLNLISQLDNYGSTLLLTALFFQIVYIISIPISNFSTHYRHLSPHKQSSWQLHIVSTLFSVLIIAFCTTLYDDPIIKADRILGSSPNSRLVHTFASGFFFWDVLISIWNLKEGGIAMLLHSLSCCFVFTVSLYPYAQGYGSVFLNFEASTIFLNLHWFLDKTGRSGSTLQLINGVLLILVFFVVRIVNGSYGMFLFVSESFIRRAELPSILWQSYTIAAIILGSLNFYWMYLMINSFRVRILLQKKKN